MIQYNSKHERFKKAPKAGRVMFNVECNKSHTYPSGVKRHEVVTRL